MENLYERLINLLDKSENSKEWIELLIALGEPSNRRQVGNQERVYRYRHYYFNDIGVSFGYDIALNAFIQVFFAIATPMVKNGYEKPFPGILHAGIKATDTRNEVELRMGMKPTFVMDRKLKALVDDEHDHLEKYVIQPFEYSYSYESPEGKITSLCVTLCKALQRYK